MGLDVFRIGVGLVLFGLMFPLSEVFRRYASEGSANFMVFVWLFAIILIFVSSVMPDERERVGAPVPAQGSG